MQVALGALRLVPALLCNASGLMFADPSYPGSPFSKVVIGITYSLQAVMWLGWVCLPSESLSAMCACVLVRSAVALPISWFIYAAGSPPSNSIGAISNLLSCAGSLLWIALCGPPFSAW